MPETGEKRLEVTAHKRKKIRVQKIFEPERGEGRVSSLGRLRLGSLPATPHPAFRIPPLAAPEWPPKIGLDFRFLFAYYSLPPPGSAAND